jgi:hypothetical protein
MQGAIPAHAYDAATLNRYTPDYPDLYAHYWTGSSPCYFNGSAGAGAYVNFFNTNDWALSWWKYNQDFKPVSGFVYGSVNGQYNFYSGSNPFYTILLPPADRYTIFAYCDPATCYALGAEAGVTTFTRKIDMHSVWPADTHPQPDGIPYVAHVWHSAQFRSDFPNRAIFWNTVLGVNGFKLK